VFGRGVSGGSGPGLHGEVTEFTFPFPRVVGALRHFPNFSSRGVIDVSYSDSLGLSRDEYSTARSVQQSGPSIEDRGFLERISRISGETDILEIYSISR
jgi:hypothetical protein